MKKILSLILASTLAVSLFAGCSEDTTSDSGEIVMGLDTSFAPMGFEEEGEIVGFDVDLARLIIEEKMGMTLVLQPIDWNSKEAELDTGKIDVAWNGLTITEERMENMCFTEAYLENKQVLVVVSGSGIESATDMGGLTVAMQEGSSAYDAYDSYIAENADAEAGTVTLLGDNVLCLTELQQGKADVVIMDSVVANYYLTTVDSYADFEVLDDSIADELYGIATQKENTELRDQIQAALDEAIADGSAAAICEEWFGDDVMYVAE